MNEVVDLEFSVARIIKPLHLDCVCLTLMSPINEDGEYFIPATSCTAWMSKDKCRELGKALIDAAG